MALSDEVLAVFQARPRRTFTSFEVACAVYASRISAAKSLKGVRFPNLDQVRLCIHDLQRSHHHLTRRRRTRPRLHLVSTTN